MCVFEEQTTGGLVACIRVRAGTHAQFCVEQDVAQARMKYCWWDTLGVIVIQVASSRISHVSSTNVSFSSNLCVPTALHASTPLVLGTPPRSALTASLSATPKALKLASALWWSLRPLSTSTCRVMRAAWAKEVKTWGIISVDSSPTRSRVSLRSISALHTNAIK